jgi:hypothetical protein
MSQASPKDRRPGSVDQTRHPNILVPIVATVSAVILKAVFWATHGALAWTHVGCPVAAAGPRRLCVRTVAKAA